MIRQKSHKALIKITNEFFEGQYVDNVGLFEAAHAALKEEVLSKKELSQLTKLFSIFFLAQLADIATLSKALMLCGIKSNTKQKQYNLICNKLTNKDLHTIYEYIFKQCLAAELAKMLAKDRSAQSRTLITVVLDDSVFKQWLTTACESADPEFERFYSKFFSGQVQQVVWGYQVATLGISIGGIFLPLYLECVRKSPAVCAAMQANYEKKTKDWKDKCAARKVVLAEIKVKKAELSAKKAALSEKTEQEAGKTEQEAGNMEQEAGNMAKKEIKDLQTSYKALNVAVKTLRSALKSAKPVKNPPEKITLACQLVEKCGKFIEEIYKKDDNPPTFQFTCDNGYLHTLLITQCQKSGLSYIGVPKKNHYITVDAQKINLKTWIETVFLPAEAAHNTAQARLEETEKETEKKTEKKTEKETEKKPFTLRIRAYYHATEQDVTFLAFRLGNSRKVSLIFSTSLSIYAKTLRRHWFVRTQIEQFFKALKHFMHIHQAIIRTKHCFEFKLLRFAFVALHLQLLIQVLRKAKVLPPKAGLNVLRLLLSRSDDLRNRLKILLT